MAPSQNNSVRFPICPPGLPPAFVPRPSRQPSYPIKQGLVEDWDAMERLWQQVPCLSFPRPPPPPTTTHVLEQTGRAPGLQLSPSDAPVLYLATPTSGRQSNAGVPISTVGIPPHRTVQQAPPPCLGSSSSKRPCPRGHNVLEACAECQSPVQPGPPLPPPPAPPPSACTSTCGATRRTTTCCSQSRPSTPRRTGVPRPIPGGGGWLVAGVPSNIGLGGTPPAGSTRRRSCSRRSA